MNSATWRKSSYSGSNGGECVEVGGHHGRVLVRDTKDRQGPVLRVSPAAWRRFADGVKNGRPLASCRFPVNLSNFQASFPLDVQLEDSRECD
jgi:hypothetical protein